MDLSAFNRAYNRVSIFMLVYGVIHFSILYFGSRPEYQENFVNEHPAATFAWGGVLLWMVVVKVIIFFTKRGWTR
jgi:hypothetical protein